MKVPDETDLRKFKLISRIMTDVPKDRIEDFAAAILNEFFEMLPPEEFDKIYAETITEADEPNDESA